MRGKQDTVMDETQKGRQHLCRDVLMCHIILGVYWQWEVYSVNGEKCLYIIIGKGIVI